eukprot:CAMPEP_0184329060 /NCGR_PEP_ID=MMETSP1049-20130417/143947_1 /TAXON_ID=77928 /ORGANISM="Proteomonas sulcata, Strain CCMP704" /LENGTH=262 /DNA_ID=CAMNT_0026651401 /DNA_START=260 /DNA_END=1045 /DNA_ORIENTATION=-
MLLNWQQSSSVSLVLLVALLSAHSPTAAFSLGSCGLPGNHPLAQKTGALFGVSLPLGSSASPHPRASTSQYLSSSAGKRASVLCLRGGAECGEDSTKFTGVRFSLYPQAEHIKPIVKEAVTGIKDLGVTVLPDDVSSCLLGPEEALFEAVRISFGRIAATGTTLSMQATFSAGCPGETDIIQTKRIVESKAWLPEAINLVKGVRVAAQFAIYPLGVPNYMDLIYREISQSKKSDVWKDKKTHFCSMLDGDGDEVFRVMQEAW